MTIQIPLDSPFVTRTEFTSFKQSTEENFARIDLKFVNLTETMVEGFDRIYDKMDERFAEVNGEIRIIKSDIVLMKADISTLKTDVAELKSDVSILKTDVAEIKSDVSILKTDVASRKSGIGLIKQHLGILG